MISLIISSLCLGFIGINGHSTLGSVESKKIRERCELLNNEGKSFEVLSYLNEIEYEHGNLLLDADLPSLYNYKGVALYELNKLHEAGVAFNMAVQHQPDDLRAWVNLAEIRQTDGTLGSFEEAITHIENLSGWKCIARQFQKAEWQNLEDRFVAQEHTFGQCLRTKSDEDCKNQLISGITFADGVVQKELLELMSRDWAGVDSVDQVSGLGDPSYESSVGFTGRMVLGVILSRIDQGPVSTLTQSLFRFIDKSRVRVVCFLLSADKGRRLLPWQQAMLRSFDSVVLLEGRDSQAAAALIRAQQVDVLIDMNGLSLSSGLMIMAHRPAPLQVSFLGDPHTTGLRFIDHFLGDRIATPPDITANHFTEKLLLLPRSYLSNSYAQWLPDVLRLPRPSKAVIVSHVLSSQQYTDANSKSYLSLNGAFLLGAFHGYVKIDPSVFSAWMAILRRSSVWGKRVYLVMTNTQQLEAMRNFQRYAQYHGVIDSKLLFLNHSGWESHMHLKGAVDLFLDTATKNGHTTSLDAAWAGLPTICLAGMESAQKRSTESVTSLLESRHGQVYSLKEYEDQAVKVLADDRGLFRLIAWQWYVRRMRTISELFKAEHFAEDFTSVLQAAFEVNLLTKTRGTSATVTSQVRSRFDGESDRVTTALERDAGSQRYHIFATVKSREKYFIA